MGVDAQEFPGGLLRLNPAFAYAEPTSSWPLSWAEFLTLAPGSDRIPVELFQILKDDAVESAALNMQYAGSRQEIKENNRRGKTRDLFKKIRDTKGTFHAKMNTIKDRNGMDFKKVEDIKKRRQEYMEELYKKRSSWPK